MKKRVLITGGFGNLGCWITRELLRAGYDVTVSTSSGRLPDELEGVSVVAFDLMQPSSVQSALHGRSFDIVIHAGSLNDGFSDDYYWRSYRANVEGTSSLLQACSRTDIQLFIYLSTFHVYGKATGMISESSSCAPRSDYATSHLAAEYIVQQHHMESGLPVCILRLTNGYGCPVVPSSAKWHLLLNDLARMAVMDNRLILKGSGNALRDFIWMGDVARAIQQICSFDRVPTRIMNLSYGSSLTLHDAAKEVQAAYRDLYDKEIPLVCGDVVDTSADSLSVDSSILWNYLGWNPAQRIREEAVATIALVNEHFRLPI